MLLWLLSTDARHAPLLCSPKATNEITERTRFELVESLFGRIVLIFGC